MASLLLGMLGNGLMVPRALFTGDKIWFIGVGWGPLTGWVQLLSLYVAYGVTGYAPPSYTSLPSFAPGETDLPIKNAHKYPCLALHWM